MIQQGGTYSLDKGQLGGIGGSLQFGFIAISLLLYFAELLKVSINVSSQYVSPPYLLSSSQGTRVEESVPLLVGVTSIGIYVKHIALLSTLFC